MTDPQKVGAICLRCYFNRRGVTNSGVNFVCSCRSDSIEYSAVVFSVKYCVNNGIWVEAICGFSSSTLLVLLYSVSYTDVPLSECTVREGKCVGGGRLASLWTVSYRHEHIAPQQMPIVSIKCGYRDARKYCTMFVEERNSVHVVSWKGREKRKC